MTSTTSAGWTIRWMTFLVLAFLLPLSLRLPVNRNEATALSFVLLVVAAWQISSIVGIGSTRFVALTFWLYVYLWAGLAPIAQVARLEFFWPGTYSEGEQFRAVGLTAWGIAAWWLGYAWIYRKPIASASRSLDRRRVMVLARLGLALGVFGVALVGIAPFFASRDELGRALGAAAGGDGTVERQLLFSVIAVPSALALFLLLWSRVDAPLTKSQKRAVGALFVLVVVTSNPVSGARFLSGSIVLALVLAGLRRLDRAGVARGVSLVLLVGVLLVFPIADTFRYEGGGNSVSVQFDQELLLHGDYDAFQQTMNGMRFADAEGLALGRQASGVVLFWVPRQIWAEKPQPTGIAVAEAEGYSFTNVSSPAFVEGYVDFGWFGAAMIALLLGAFAGRLDKSFATARSSIWGLLAPLYAGYQLVILRGTLMAVVPFLALWVALVLMVLRRQRTLEVVGAGLDRSAEREPARHDASPPS